MGSVQQCSICFDELAERLTAAPCGHVFHTECITPWHDSGGKCPMCKTAMQRKLLRLFFEPRQARERTIEGSTNSNPKSPPECEAGCETGTVENQPVSAEVTGLRRELASTRKVIAASKEDAANNASAMEELRTTLGRVRAAAALAENERDAAIKAAEAKLQTTRIELCKRHTEVNRLKREMEGITEQLRKHQDDKVAQAYLSQFAVQAAGARSLSGLGQVNVETVLEQVAQGSVSANSIIRGQHDFLSVGMDREQKTKRKLRESKVEAETTALKLASVQAKLLRASKEIHRLRKALSEPKIDQGAGGAPKPSRRSPLGGTGGQQMSKEGGGGSRENYRTPVSASSHRVDEGKKRPAPSSVGGRGVGALGLVRGEPTAKRRGAAVRVAEEEEEEDGMVSLGSDDGESGSEAENKEANYRQRRREERRTLLTGSRGLLGRDALLTPAITPRTFFPGAAGRGRVKGQPAQFIGRGYNATGGTHNVRKPAVNKPSFTGK